MEYRYKGENLKMNENLKNNEMFQTSHIMILICYTILSCTLIAEALLLGWEKWALILIAVSLMTAWVVHIRQRMSSYTRLWFYSMLMMVTYFFYGIHLTSTFDLCAVMTAIIMLYTMTGVPGLIYLCQATFIITFAYDIASLIQEGVELTSLFVTRSMLHVAIILMVGWIARVILDRWERVLGKVKSEIGELRESTDRLGDFLANVSHEIRTPANAIIGFTGVGLEKETDPGVRQDMTYVMEAGQRISDQISDILDYSEIDRGTIATNREDYTISSVVFDVTAQIAPILAPECELIVDIDPSVPAVMNTDVVKLKKILHHLFENSLKYTMEGGVYAYITARQEEYGVNLHIDVKDTGIGMEEKETEKALLGFYQGDSSRTRKGGGLGLGLAIVSGFVSALGGFLTIKSKIGEGTRISLSIPQEVVDPGLCMSLKAKEKLCLGAFIRFGKFKNPDVREFYGRLMKTIVGELDIKIHRVESLSDLKKLCEKVSLTHLLVGVEEYRAATEYLESLAEKTMVVVAAREDFIPEPGSGVILLKKPVTGFSVVEILNMEPGERQEEDLRLNLEEVQALVVDDESMNLSVAKGILGRYSMTIDTVLSGHEAIEACEKKEYDIVFMDHMMPGMDGIEAAKRIWAGARAKGQKFAIVALTANAVSTAKEMFLSEGFDGFISKPIEINELERVMRRVLPRNKVKFEKIETNTVRNGGSFRNMTGKSAAGSSGSGDGNSNTAGSSGNGAGNNGAAGSSGSAADFSHMTEAGILTEQGMAYCAEDPEFYRSLLLQYEKEAPVKEGRLMEAYGKKDWKNYEIFVHALKSTSKMIGAADLSEAAKALEAVAAEGIDIPEEGHERMLTAYRAVAAAIRSDLGVETDAGKDGADPGKSEAAAGGADAGAGGAVWAADDGIMEFEPEADDDAILEFDAK